MCYGGGGLHPWSWREGEVDFWLCNGSCHPWSWREVKLTLLGVWFTLGDPGGLDGLRFGRRRWLGIGVTVGLAVGSCAGD